ncbi:hypothetical protein BASA81_006378 [Batrachochytrium salamandrivorans]|nr:hypothetical protein BASA81_006378 [Batrachochytrium salamandrivorans]
MDEGGFFIDTKGHIRLPWGGDLFSLNQLPHQKINLLGHKLGIRGVRQISRLLDSLTELHWVNGELDDTMVELVATSLETNASLLLLNLARNEMLVDGLQALCTALQSNTTLQELDASSNGITSPQSLVAVGNMLEANSTLRVLRLGRNGLGGSGAGEELTEALGANSSLTELHLEFNQIGFDFIRPLALGLGMNRGLVKLDLFGNRLDVECVALLCEAVERENSALREVDIGGGELDLASFNLAATKLMGRLAVVGLAQTGMGPQGGATPIALALEQTATLVRLDLSQNQLGEEGVRTIVRALQGNAIATVVHLEWNEADVSQINEHGLSQITSSFWTERHGAECWT